MEPTGNKSTLVGVIEEVKMQAVISRAGMHRVGDRFDETPRREQD
jgi:hypothetical protein